MSTHHGYIEEFNGLIRVDAFDGTENPFFDPISDPMSAEPIAYCLTHAHTDHLTGLNSPRFQGRIFCTAATKAIVLMSMDCANRWIVAQATEAREQVIASKLKFKNLQVINGRKKVSDSIVTLEINQPKQVRGKDGEVGAIKITALDANHCPGSCMFLIEGLVEAMDAKTGSITVVRRAVIVTGDIRAEPHWIQALSNNPILSPYLRTKETDEIESEIWRRLDNIYLDTTNVLCDVDVPTKKEAVDLVVSAMQRYPSNTRFFLNCWTYGYESLLEAISRAFNQKIHFDWFKQTLYNEPSIRQAYPSISNLGTDSSDALRFHACERRWKCDQAWDDGIGCYLISEEEQSTLHPSKKRTRCREHKGSWNAQTDEVVTINPVRLSRQAMREYFVEANRRIDSAQQSDRRRRGMISINGPSETTNDQRYPRNIFAAIDRHSSLPELRSFVALFRPSTLYPLTMTHGKDQPTYPEYAALGRLFEGVLPYGAKDRLDEAAQRAIDEVGSPPKDGTMMRVTVMVDHKEEDLMADVDTVKPMHVCEGTSQLRDLMRHDDFAGNVSSMDNFVGSLDKQDLEWIRMRRDGSRAIDHWSSASCGISKRSRYIVDDYPSTLPVATSASISASPSTLTPAEIPMSQPAATTSIAHSGFPPTSPDPITVSFPHHHLQAPVNSTASHGLYIEVRSSASSPAPPLMSTTNERRQQQQSSPSVAANRISTCAVHPHHPLTLSHHATTAHTSYSLKTPLAKPDHSSTSMSAANLSISIPSSSSSPSLHSGSTSTPTESESLLSLLSSSTSFPARATKNEEKRRLRREMILRSQLASAALEAHELQQKGRMQRDLSAAARVDEKRRKVLDS